ncbi:3-methyl-2-oxobutanoate hydroxymethyltransferase [Lignipirellula cremea]|uniref:3-methyl-2-oxobutanoate hydroxymethyltransferase n=1 Tax=Lignipirellula cremea TaxID=2528010 RepID=A0A518DUH1_9BACT|nr:3-methyl-2-oxobutanoate hydroxymethyltransferase [Lignipirellula cremea]QDU95485.1 3-methyl-2-oxobutanoate hydroxymethyltransferase [Lignipirellula cremea]
MSSSPRRLTVPQFVALKSQGKKIAMLTGYDYPTAQLIDAAGVDAILVGDTVGVVVQGRENTLPVTLDEIIYHAEMVGRATKSALLIGDLPFGSYQLGVSQAIESASRILKETACQAVKLEGGTEQAAVIAGLTGAGIPVMAHVGVRPQSVHQMGGYKVQRDESQLLIDAHSAEQAGAFSIVLECLPSAIAAKITKELTIPTIGIGAGVDCDGQVLVLHDMLGLTDAPPRFVKQYADLGSAIQKAAAQYCKEVRNGEFPTAKHAYR